jgi:PAS domain S-box-containing protein
MENNLSPTIYTLHQKAKALLETKSAIIGSDHPESEALMLIQELLTHQSAIEKQNKKSEQDETDIQKEREYLKDIFNNQPAGLYRIRVFSRDNWKSKSWTSSDNPPYVMEYASDKFCEILGVTRNDFVKNPYLISDLVHSEDKESFAMTNDKANKKLTPFRWEGRLIINKKAVWVRLESLPRPLDSGDVLWTGIIYNMTAWKKAEDALNETRLRLEEVLEGANVGTLEWNVQTGKIKFNKIWANNLGYKGIEIKLGMLLFGKKGWKTITHPEDIPYAENMLQRHFSGEFPLHSVEVRMRHRKGHWVWIRQEGKVKTWTPDGKPLLMYGTHTDISKRKEMELELRNNEEKYRILFANNPQPMLIFDPASLKILEVNQSLIDHYGYSRKELMSMTIAEIRPAEDINEMKIAVKEITLGPRSLGVRRHKKKNGEIIFVELKSHTIRYNETTAIHVLINDITEQKRAEQALFDLNNQLEERINERTSELLELNASLKQTEVKFKTVTNFTYDWEYWKGADNKILFMSPSVERTTGYTVSEFENCPELLDKIIYPGDIAIWEKHKKERCNFNSDEKKLELVFRIITKAGETRWIGHVCRCISIDDKYLGVRVSNRDITETVNAENRLLNTTIDVEERERNRFSRELHDGMGPLLSTIKLYFQWLSDTNDREKRQLITEKGNYSIEMAIQTARELARGLGSQFVSDKGYVLATKDFIERINETNKIRISFTNNTIERFGGFFELMLYRITTELIKNTLTYANATEVEIRFDFNKSKNTISFAYKDNGIGFDWEKIQKEQKGLGLKNIQQRVLIMKGNIEIMSKLNEGMTTVIMLHTEGTLENNSHNF